MRSMLFSAALAVAALAGCSKADSSETTKTADAKVPTMTVDDLDRALAAKQAQPVDCNGDGTRKKMGYVPGAILVTSDDAYAASELPADKTMKLVFYCANPG
jgi:hypothetical protein